MCEKMGDAGLYSLFYKRTNISPSTYLISMKIEAERISEMMVSTYKTMHHIPADVNLLIYFCKNLRVAQYNLTNKQELLLHSRWYNVVLFSSFVSGCQNFCLSEARQRDVSRSAGQEISLLSVNKKFNSVCT